MHPKSLVALAILTVASALACAPAPGDYMAADLRSRVEQLKADVAEAPTTAETLPTRLEVLWDWANAYARAGGALPVNLPQLVGQLGTAVSDGSQLPPSGLEAVDRYVHELTIKDETPDAIGMLRFASSDAIPVASWQTIRQVYTVGSMAMQPGGVVLVARQLVSDQGFLQHEDPAADNYLSIRCSNPAATFEPLRIPLAGMHGGYRRGEGLPAFRLEGAGLSPGDTFTVTYGDTSGGSRGFEIQTWSTDRLKLPLYLDLDGSGRFLTPVWPALELVGDEVEAARAVVPSVVAVGEPFELAVRSEDRYTNRATGAIPAYQLLLNGEPFGRIEGGGEAIVVLDNLVIDEPGVYRFTIRTDDGSITATSNPLWVREDPPCRVYWGETHGHIDFAEGQGSPERYFRYGRDDARLDFLTLSEHDIWLDDFEWQRMQELTRTSTEEGRFVAFLGYEWTVALERGGHHNVLFRRPDRQRVGIHRASRLPGLYRILGQENEPDDVLVIPHAHQAGDWTRNDPELERLVEMYSMQGTFEWFGNFYLRNGFRIGFIGASDDHRARPGYARGLTLPRLIQLGGLAAVQAPAKTGDAIFDAMRNLSAYASSGQRIILDATLNGSRMGSRQQDAAERRLTCRVMGTAAIDSIEVIKNGEVVFSQRYLTAPFEAHNRILVGFESSSEVFGEVRQNPRGYRPWQGTVEVRGATVVDVSAPGFDNPSLERVEVDAHDPNLIRFSTITRGRRNTMLMELEGASPATTLVFRLQPARLIGESSASADVPVDLPATDFRLRLSDLRNGRIEHELRVGRHTDRVTLEVVDPAGALDREFEFTDLVEPRPGDYYYVRVTQVDGGRAWSSPFWVGDGGG